MSSFIIKLIAIVSMTIDHANYVFAKQVSLNVIGRLAFPLFCFQLVVGFEKTKNLLKYLARMLVFAFITEIPYLFYIKSIGRGFELNVLFTLFLGLIAMYVYDLKIENKQGKLALTDHQGKNLIEKMSVQYEPGLKALIVCFKTLLIVFITLLCHGIKAEYGAWGILIILFIHAFYPFKSEINLFGTKIKIKKEISNLLFLLGFLIFAIQKYTEFWRIIPLITTIAFTIFTFIPAIIMLLNNGKKGLNLKYFFYIYYPAQFIILGILNM